MRFEPDSRLRAEAAGVIEYGLFVPEALIGDQPGRSVRSKSARRYRRPSNT
jgi:hypothetical protein